MNQQTAVEWLKDNLPSLFEDDSSSFYADLFDQAKEMEKQQIYDAWLAGVELGSRHDDAPTCELYYIKIYGSE